MIGIVVAAHGDLAEALVRTARSVVGSEALVEPVTIEMQDDAETYRARLQAAVETVRSDRGVLVITDMFGGTPSNVGMTLHDPGAVEVLTGANLPMLIKALQLSERDGDLATIAGKVKAAGRQAIAVATEMLVGSEATSESGGES